MGEVGGILATWGGFCLSSVAWQRSVGLEPDTAIATALVTRQQADRLNVTEPKPGEIFGGRPSDAADPGVLTTGPNDYEIPDVIPFVSDLQFAMRVGAETWPKGDGVLSVRRMFLASAEKPDAFNQGGLGVMTLSLYDERGLYQEFGLLDTHWLFNAPRADNQPFVDTTNPDTKKPWTLPEVVTHLLSRLPFRPTLARVPPAWERITHPRFVFTRMSKAVDALGEVLRKYPARPCLNLDGTWSFYSHGEAPTHKGGFGYASGGSTKNDALLPLEFILHGDGGSGATVGRSLSARPDWVVVAGGPRIATVAIDCCEPVLRVGGDILPYSEGLALMIRGTDLLDLEEELVSARARLGRARAEGQPTGDLVAEVAALSAKLRDLRAKTSSKATPQELAYARRLELRPLSHRVFSGRKAKSRARLWRVIAQDGDRLYRVRGADGENQHLLPLLERAETKNGVPLPIQAQTYTFRQVTRPVSLVGRGEITSEPTSLVTEDEQAFNAAVFTLSSLFAQIKGYASGLKTLSGFGVKEAIGQVEDELRGKGTDKVVIPPQRPSLGYKLTPIELPPSILRIIYAPQSRIRAGARVIIRDVENKPRLKARLRDRLKTSPESLIYELVGRGIFGLLPTLIAEQVAKNPNVFGDVTAVIEELGSRYETALATRNAAGARLSNRLFVADLEVELAKEARKLGDKAKAFRSLSGIDTTAAIAIVEKIAQRIVEFQRRAAAVIPGLTGPLAEIQTLGDTEAYATATAFVNEPRDVADVTVEDAALGLFRVSLAGHINRSDVEDKWGQQLIPRAVRLVFGVTAAPRREPPSVSRSPLGRLLTGQPAAPEFDWCTSEGLPEADQEAEGDVIPPQVQELQDAPDPRLGYYTAAFRREPSGAAAPVPLSSVPFDQASVVEVDPSEFTERIGILGESNKADLDKRAKFLAEERFRAPSLEDQARRVYLGPWRTLCDGVVAGVEIRTEDIDGVTTLVTEVSTGEDNRAFRLDNKTRVRKKKEPPQDPRFVQRVRR